MRSSRASRLMRSALFTLAFVYLAFHSLHGEQGVYALLKENYKVGQLEAELERAQQERELLEHRVSLMRDESLDADMLDEQSRRYLGVVRDDEVMLLLD